MSDDIFEGVEIDDEVKNQLAERVNATLQAKLDEETKGLKSKVDELLGEKKAAQKAREAAQLEAKQRAEERRKPRTIINSFSRVKRPRPTPCARLSRK
jgi:hypothetical protein